MKKKIIMFLVALSVMVSSAHVKIQTLPRLTKSEVMQVPPLTSKE